MLWGRYGNYRNIYETLKIIANTPDGPITATEKKGAGGVLKTMLALEMLHIIEARAAIGAVVDMTDDPNAVLAFVSEDSVYKWITAKLDEANADLTAAGATPFYFPVNNGFSAFGVTANTPAGFISFNRALKARVEAKRGSLGCGATCYTAVLTALTASLAPDLTAANRDIGIYVIYSTATGDALNGSSFATNSNLYVHPQIDGLPGAALDDRYKRKTCSATARTPVSVTAAPRGGQVVHRRQAGRDRRSGRGPDRLRRHQWRHGRDAIRRAQHRCRVRERAPAATDPVALPGRAPVGGLPQIRPARRPRHVAAGRVGGVHRGAVQRPAPGGVRFALPRRRARAAELPRRTALMEEAC